MAKQTKFLRKEAEKAEEAARRTSDPARANGLRALASAYRSQAAVIERKKKEGKNKL